MGFAGKAGKTKSGLKKTDLVKNKSGKIVSKKSSARGKASPWIAAVKAARTALKIKGFLPSKRAPPCTTRQRSSTRRSDSLRVHRQAPALWSRHGAVEGSVGVTACICHHQRSLR